MLVFCTAVLLINDIAIAAVFFGVVVALWFSARLPIKLFWSFMKVLLPIAAFLFVIQAIFYPGETALIKPLIPIGRGFGQVTLEGILFSVLLALRLMAMIVMLPLISFTTPVQNFAMGMVKIGLPYTLAYTMTTALNLVPLLQTETQVIVDAQKLRAMQTLKGQTWRKTEGIPRPGYPAGDRFHAPGAIDGSSYGFPCLRRHQEADIYGRYHYGCCRLDLPGSDHYLQHRDRLPFS